MRGAVPGRFCDRPALTLVEMLVALFLLLLLISGGLLLISSAGDAWFRGETEVRTRNEAALFVSFLNRHLPGAIIEPGLDGPGPAFVGGPEELFFCALVFSGPGRTDFARLALRFDRERETIFLVKRRGGEADGDFQVRDRRGEEPLLFPVSGLRFTYLDRDGYLPEWDSRPGRAQENRLPRAVRGEFFLPGPRSRRGQRPVSRFEATWEIRTHAPVPGGAGPPLPGRPFSDAPG